MSAEASPPTPPPSGPDLTDEQRVALEAARCLARAGVPIFVAPPISSDPTGFGLPKRWQDTRPGEHSLAAVDRWRPGWALAAVMGHVVDALDVDPRHGGEATVYALMAEGAWPECVAVQRTPSGGWHAFVPTLGVGSRDGVRPGLDVKGGRTDGTGRGFVFLAPTERVSKADGELRAYSWDTLPDELDDLAGFAASAQWHALAEVVRSALERRPAPSSSTGGTVLDLDEAREAREHTGPIPDGERHAALVSYAGRLRARGLSYDEAEILYLRRWGDCAQPPAAKYPVTRDEALDKLRDVFGRYDAPPPRADPTVLMLPPGPAVVPAAPGVVGAAVPDGAVGASSPDAPASSWARVDLRPFLDGTHVAPVPTLLPRADGVCLLYRGLVHSIHGESESGKSWVAQAEAARLLAAGRPVLFVDHESDPAAVVERLLALGVAPAALAAHLDYRRPETAPTAAHELPAWADMLSGRYDLAVVDGVTDSLGLFGAKTTDNDEVAAWLRRFPRQLARRTGAAVVVIDHVTKDADTRGRFAIGGQAKMAGLDGAAYVVDVVDPLGRGLRGVLTLRVAKDRPGTVRGRSGRMRKTDRTQEAARFVLDATGDRLVVALEAPDMSGGEVGATFRPTGVMERVSRYVEGKPGASKARVEEGVGGKREVVRAALRTLVDEGYVREDEVPRGRSSWLHYTSLEVFREASDTGPRLPLTPLNLPLDPTSPNLAPTSPRGDVAKPRPLAPPYRGEGEVAVPSTTPANTVPRGEVETASCQQCGRSPFVHSPGQWSTCESCGLTWHRWGAGGRPRCPRCSP